MIAVVNGGIEVRAWRGWLDLLKYRTSWCVRAATENRAESVCDLTLRRGKEQLFKSGRLPNQTRSWWVVLRHQTRSNSVS